MMAEYKLHPCSARATPTTVPVFSSPHSFSSLYNLARQELIDLRFQMTAPATLLLRIDTFCLSLSIAESVVAGISCGGCAPAESHHAGWPLLPPPLLPMGYICCLIPTSFTCSLHALSIECARLLTPIQFDHHASHALTACEHPPSSLNPG